MCRISHAKHKTQRICTAMRVPPNSLQALRHCSRGPQTNQDLRWLIALKFPRLPGVWADKCRRFPAAHMPRPSFLLFPRRQRCRCQPPPLTHPPHPRRQTCSDPRPVPRCGRIRLFVSRARRAPTRPDARLSHRRIVPPFSPSPDITPNCRGTMSTALETLKVRSESTDAGNRPSRPCRSHL